MERFEKKRKLSIFQWILLITLNSILPWFIWEVNELLFIPIFFSVITLIWITIRKFTGKKQEYISNTRSDYLSLMKKYMYINKKYIFASIIGIILSIAIFSSSFLIIDSYKTQFYEESGLYDSPIITTENSGIANFDEYDQWVDLVSTDISTIIENNGYEVTKIDHYIEFNSQIPTARISDNNISIIQLETSEYTKKIYDILEENKYITGDYDPSARILVSSVMDTDFIEKLSNGSYQAPLLINSTDLLNNKDGFDYVNYQHMNITFDQLIFISSNEYIDILPDDYYSINSGINQRAMLFQTQERTENMILEYIDKSNGTYIDDFYKIITAKSEFYTNIDNLDMNINTAQDMFSLQSDIREWSYNNVERTTIQIDEYAYYDQSTFELKMPLKSKIFLFSYRISELQTANFIASVLLYILTLYLVFFTISMVVKRKERVLSTMKMRGTDVTQVKYMLLFEFMVSTSIAILIGMALSVPWTRISLSSSGFLQFANISMIISIPSSWYYKIPIFGMIIALDVNYSTINSLSRVGIDDGQNAEETKKPFWQRKNLDLIFFSIAVIYWIIIQFINPTKNEYLYFLLVGVIGLYMLTIILVTSPLVTARFFSDILLFLSKRMWKKDNNITSLSIKTMQKYRYTISKLVALIMIGSLLSVMAITIPPSFNNQQIERGYYDTGADMNIANIDMNDQKVLAILSDDRIEVYSEYQLTFFTKSRSVYTSSEGPYVFYFLGIDPDTFEAATFWKDDYSRYSLQSIIDAIDDGNNDSVALQSIFMRSQDVEIGSQIKLGLSEIAVPYTFNVKADYELFPNLVNDLPYYNSWDDSYFIFTAQILMTLDNLRAFTNSSFPEDITVSNTKGVYINVKNGVDLEEFRGEILEKLIGTSISIADKKSDVPEIYDNIIFGALHSLLIIFIIVSFIAFAYYSYISINERKREIGVFRAMGMVKKQIFHLFISENIIILMSGLIIGVIMGMFTSLIVFKIYIAGFSRFGIMIPPFRISVPFDILGIYIGIVILINAIAIVIPPKYLSSTQVGSILRMD